MYNKIAALFFLIVLVACNQQVPILPEQTSLAMPQSAEIDCSYAKKFNLSESANDDELTSAVNKNVIDVMGLMYDKVNEFHYLKCNSSGKNITCARKYALDCWWEDNSPVVNVTCGSFSNGTFIMKETGGADTITRKVKNHILDQHYFDYLSEKTIPGCANPERYDCPIINFSCVTSKEVEFNCIHNERNIFNCTNVQS